MLKQLIVWQLIAESLRESVPVMLLYVLQSEGSSPGRQGFAMAVNGQGKMKGSIGGGIMEHKFVEMAKEKLKTPKSEVLIRKQIHDKQAAKDQSGMICSGEQTVFMYRVNESDAVTIYKILEIISTFKTGHLQLSPMGISVIYTIPLRDFYYKYLSYDDWKYQEKLGYKNHLSIIGAGHCSLALCKVMSMMDFFIHLYDDRSCLNTFEENSYAHEKVILEDYSKVENFLSNGHFVIVMTMGYRTDDIVVRALLKRKFKYFGVLGSRAKIETMFRDYEREGISTAHLARITSPAGIQIKSRTPEEIAVSIAAEIIKVKNELP